VRRNISILDPD